ncbi:MAG: hypothetical protein AAF269_00615 [Pseudomonadota bacterium]
MSTIPELAELYDARGYYVRERRPFRQRRVRRPNRRFVKKNLPATFTLRPLKHHRVFGGRTGALDRLQGVSGYFFGGGWVFGFVENERFRATPDAFDAYSNNAKSDLVFRAGNVASTRPAWKQISWQPGDKVPTDIPADRYVQVTVKRSLFDAAGALPPKSKLRKMDLLSFAHDRELRDRDAQVWDGAIAPGDAVYCALTNNAHLKLRKGLKAIKWSDVIDEWKRAKSQMPNKSWQGMGSLIHYEKDLANFSQLVLGFAIYSDTPIDVTNPVAVPEHAHVDVRLAPPSINSRKITLDDLRKEDPDLTATQARTDVRHLMEEQKMFKEIRARDEE